MICGRKWKTRRLDKVLSQEEIGTFSVILTLKMGLFPCFLCEKKDYFRFLLSVKPSHSFIQIPLRAWCWCFANLGAACDEDVLGEGAHVVGFEQQDVVAKVEKGPALPLFFKILLEKCHLVVRGDG